MRVYDGDDPGLMEEWRPPAIVAKAVIPKAGDMTGRANLGCEYVEIISVNAGDLSSVAAQYMPV
jgi:hypothetical protein